MSKSLEFNIAPVMSVNRAWISSIMRGSGSLPSLMSPRALLRFTAIKSPCLLAQKLLPTGQRDGGHPQGNNRFGDSYPLTGKPKRFRGNAHLREIVAAAKSARIHDFISGLPEGYDTLVGERGMSLSGGERQRISLARAFLRDAPILILDEPTSSVDTGTEAEIMEALEELVRGRTSIIITHRPSTIKDCDVLLKIENGQLI